MGGPVIEKDTTYVAGISMRLAGCSTARILIATSLPSPPVLLQERDLGHRQSVGAGGRNPVSERA